jgi:hypothetical protein
MPSPIVIDRVMGSGSFDNARRGGGTKPFIVPSFSLGI